MLRFVLPEADTVTMPAALVNITVEVGATYRRTFALAYDATATEPVDLTGCTARMHFRRAVADEEIMLEATTENGSLSIDGPAGAVHVYLTDELTDTLTGKRAVYDLEIEYPSGDVDRLVEGRVNISPNVTRSVA